VLAEQMMSPSAMRDRLTTCVYLDNPAIACLEEALQQCMIAEPIERRLKDAVKSGVLPCFDTQEPGLQLAIVAQVITAAEAAILRNYRLAYIEAIRVDAFPKEFFKRKFYV